MIRYLEIYKSFENQIDYHLALEEYLMTRVKESSGILFLWSNHPTVVIGRNQNPWRECNLEAMEQDGVTLARRKSGGGAVYQDPGNLNLTFICRQADYDVEKQTGLWIQALAHMGIAVRQSGRNDLLLPNGRKCSGMAFSQTGDVCLMHGTLLVGTDLECLEKYLNVSKEKLVTKGIASVRSRVGNLSDYRADLTVEQVAEDIAETAKIIYKEACIQEKEIPDETSFLQFWDRYQSWDWKYGHKMQFTWSRKGRFLWGEVQIYMQIKDGVIRDCHIISDSLYPDVNAHICDLLRGERMDVAGIRTKMDAYAEFQDEGRKKVIWETTNLIVS